MDSTTGPTSTGSTSRLLPEIRTMSPFAPIPIAERQNNEITVTSSSVTSHDSFMTALTSTPSPSSPSTSRLVVTTSHSLRKSVSVDSFISARGRSPDISEPGPSSTSQTGDYARTREAFTGNHSIAAYDVQSRYDSAADINSRYTHSSGNSSSIHRILGRARGHSLSGPTVAEYDDPYLDDSEHERTLDLAHLPMLSSHRFSHFSPARPNGSSKGKARARPGDTLLLPPRSQALSSPSSVSSFNTSSSMTTTSPRRPSVPPVPPVPPNRSRRPTPSTLILPRTRSESLGTNPSKKYVGDVCPGPYTIAVIGAAGVGKTTLIRKGLKGYFDGIGDETHHTAPTSYGKVRYGKRKIRPCRFDEIHWDTYHSASSRSEAIPSYVLEVDIHQLALGTPGGLWPDTLPAIDGALVAYDVTNPSSFTHIEDLLSYFYEQKKSAMLIACKSELDSHKKITPVYASQRTAPYKAGLVEVSSSTDRGKAKMRNSFHFLCKSIDKARRGDISIPKDSTSYNPASPDLLSGPWSEGQYEESRTGNARSIPNTSNGNTSSPATLPPHIPPVHPSPSPTGASTPTPKPPSVPTSPTRVKSTNDLISESQRGRQEERSLDGRSGMLLRSTSLGRLTQDGNQPASFEPNTNGCDDREGIHESNTKGGRNSEPPPMPWATLDELLDKLFFLAVSGDDLTFINHFFLTYRKFATPRTVVLGMQKRIRQLNQETSEPILSGYAQMRMCDLLEEWLKTYPHDFATPGTHEAISALVRQISSNPTTLHYASDILPVLDTVSQLEDVDVSWSMTCTYTTGESEDEPLEEDYDEGVVLAVAHINNSPTAFDDSSQDLTSFHSNKSQPNSTRDRKGSFPMSSKSINSGSIATSTSSISVGDFASSSKIVRPIQYTSPKALLKVAQAVATCNPQEMAEQITKMQSELFMQIEPRQWLRYAMGEPKPDPNTDPISASATLYNKLAFWVSSLIVAHDKVKAREKQVERFVELAKSLRTLNNYVGLRAVMTGINNATFSNDEIMTIFKENKLRLYQQYLGYGVLMNSQHNHRAYRIALRHTIGAAVPDMEVHTFDIVRAHESNINYNPDDASKIHWGKFTLMGRMITMLQGLQEKIRSSGSYNYPERPYIRQHLEYGLLDPETIQSRVFLPSEDAEPIHPLAQAPPIHGQDSPNMSRGTDSRMRKLFFWNSAA